MKFHEKYTNEHDKEKPENKDKIAISDETFALIEVIENKLEQIRLSLK